MGRSICLVDFETLGAVLSDLKCTNADDGKAVCAQQLIPYNTVIIYITHTTSFQFGLI